MSADKVLECPRCPFATELRHHLEYHLRSHYGSRPYKCDKCTYRCYNQSMLNSHAKSHTNVYQFRCADCQFAAKYCHSLKVRYQILLITTITITTYYTYTILTVFFNRTIFFRFRSLQVMSDLQGRFFWNCCSMIFLLSYRPNISAQH